MRPRRPLDEDALVLMIPSTHAVAYSVVGITVLAHVVKDSETLCGLSLPQPALSSDRPQGFGGVCAKCAETPQYNEIAWEEI